jgi:DNA-binding CsgD family transcriptional regulator
VHEREEELELLSAALDGAAAGAGSALLLEGPAGIGKTTVLGAATAAAGNRGLLALRVRGSELERSHAFGGARRLLSPGASILGERGFRGQGAAARAVLEDVVPIDSQAPPQPVEAHQLGLLAMIGSLCDERGPLLLAADDAHLLDDPTLDLLTMLCVRLEELPVVLAVAARTGTDDLRPPLARLASERSVRRLELAPLGAAGVGSVLERVLGGAVDAELVDASLEATGGNPWFVTALAGELARARPRAIGPSEVRALAPHAIAGAVDARVAAVPDGPALARALVTLGDQAELRQAATLAELSLERALEVRDELTAAGILRADELRFAHAIVRDAVASAVAPGRQALDHRRAARLLADEGLSSERVAAHLLDSEPAGEEWALEQLVDAAAVARERGAPALAVRLLERARAEARGDSRQAELLARLGTAELEAGNAPSAVEHLTEALAPGGEPDVDVVRHLAQAHASTGYVERAIETLERALDGPGLSAAGRAALTADFVLLGTLGPEVGARSRGRLEALGEVDDSTPEGRLVLAARARVLTTDGDDLEGTVEVAVRALGDGKLAAESVVWPAWSYATYALITADRLDAAVREIERSLETAVARASVGWYCAALMLRAEALLRSGPVDRALADAETAVQAALDHELQPLPTSVGCLAGARLESGEPEAALRTFAERGLDGELVDHILYFPLLYERGRARLAVGDTEASVRDLLDLGERERRWQAPNPGGYPWRVAALRGLRRLGRNEEARALAAGQAAEAERWPSARARCLALMAGGLAEDDRARAEEHFVAAAAIREPATVMLRIEALIELGRTIRQQGERARARPVLRDALAEAERSRASRLAGVAETELRAARGRPPKRTYADDELTPSERRIAELAASGSSNREIAASLFLSVRTVETHLTSAYRRLAISSRRELPEALAQRATDATQAAGS